MCARWHSFENFLADMGERPVDKTLDRIDNDGNYEPGNCRWVTAREQAQNCRTNVLTPTLALEVVGRLEHGESKRSIARRLGVRPATVGNVVRGLNWSNVTGITPPHTECIKSCSNRA